MNIEISQEKIEQILREEVNKTIIKEIKRDNEKLSKTLEDIFYMISSVIEDDNNRNYGDRDVGLHKLKNYWEDFIELHPTSDCPYLSMRKGGIKVGVPDA